MIGGRTFHRNHFIAPQPSLLLLHSEEAEECRVAPEGVPVVEHHPPNGARQLAHLVNVAQQVVVRLFRHLVLAEVLHQQITGQQATVPPLLVGHHRRPLLSFTAVDH